MNPIPLDQALETLHRLIDTGIEFPDAQWQVTEQFHLSPEQVDQLCRAYDDADPSASALLSDLSMLLSQLYADAEAALKDDWDCSDAGFEAQQIAIDQFAKRYQIPLVDVGFPSETH